MENKKRKYYQKSSQYFKKHLLSAGISGNVLLAGAVITGSSALFSNPIVAKAAVLGVEIFGDTSLSNNTTSSLTNPYAKGTQQNVNFTVSGSSAVTTTALSGTRYAVIVIPPELRGNVRASEATGNTNVSVDLTQVPLITGLVGTLNNNLTGLTSVVNTVTNTAGLALDTTRLYRDLNLLQSVVTIDQGVWSQTATLSSDGSMIIINMDNGIGSVLASNIIDILQDLKLAVNELQVTVTGPDQTGLLQTTATTLNTTLDSVKSTLSSSIDGVLTPALNDATTLTQQLLDASVLGSSTVSVPTTINIPPTPILSGTVTSKFVGTIVQSDALDVSVLSNAAGFSNIYWQGADVALPSAPIITRITGNSTNGYVVTGTADPGTTIQISDPATSQVIGSTTTDTLGNYSVTLPAGTVGANVEINATATDTSGNVSSPTSAQTPADSTDTTAPSAPTITAVTGDPDHGYTVTGTAEVGATVEVKNASGTVIGSTTANGSGNYSATLPTGTIGANEDINVTATDAAGNVSAPSSGRTPAIVPDRVAPTAPIVTGVTGNSTVGYVVTGTTEPEAVIIVRDSAGNILSSTRADDLGNYSATLPAGSIGAEADIAVTATDAVGNVSTPTAGQTPADPADTTAPSAPAVTAVTGISTSGYTVTGTTEADATVEVKNDSGTVIGTTTADGSGNYSVTLPAGSIGAGADIAVTATDAAGNVSTPTAGQTPADPADTTAPSAPTVTAVTGSSTSGYIVTGTTEPGALVNVRNSLEVIVGSGLADSFGNYTVILPAGSIGAEADINVTAVDGAGNVSAPTPSQTPADSADTTAPSSPIITSVTGSSTSGYIVTGTTEPGALVIVRNSSEAIIGSTFADVLGNYSVTLPAGSIGAEAVINVTATDEAGNVSTPSYGKTPADPKDTTAPSAPIISDITKNPAGGYDVKGTAEPGSTITIIDSKGNTIGTGTTEPTGRFVVTLRTSSVKPGDVLLATATDESGNVSNASLLQIPLNTVVPVNFGGTNAQLGSSGLPKAPEHQGSLPETGEENNMAQAVGGFSLLAFASILMAKLRRKKDIK